MRVRFLAIALLLAGLVAGPVEGRTVTFRSLVDQLTDLEALADFPSPTYTNAQASSYDRRSTDESVLTDENWFANGDAGQFMRTEENDGQTEYVMMDAEGPGAIVRIWSANANDAGNIRIYLDGSETPVIDMPMQDMTDGKNWPYEAPLAGIHSRGWNSFLPIPYARHCKVTATKNRFYYQVNYRTYPAGTAVQSFTPDLPEKHRAAIEQARDVLANPAMPPMPNVKQGTLHLSAAAGGSAEATFTGKRQAIFRLAVRAAASDVEQALRKTVLQITFDGADQPQVECPLGDFFGTAPGINPYQSLPLGMMSDGMMYCNWVMPFRQQATVRIVNHTAGTVTLDGTVDLGRHGWNDRTMYFNANWRMDHPIPTRPRRDWRFLHVNGKGVFVGDSLNITNPVTAWWGEGDEKIFVDGEKFPSTFGTGSEDYYGYAWCDPTPFVHAYHNQPRCDGPGNFGQTSVNRFHVIDAIPFQQSFVFDMEVWHWADTQVGMAAVSYWYERPESLDFFPPIKASDLRIPSVPGPKKVKGALEGETMKVASKSSGVTETQPMDSMHWSGGEHLWWRGAKVGDTLVLSFPAPRAGLCEVYAAMTRAPDYGVMKITVNGRDIGKTLDFYARGIQYTGEVRLGMFQLEKGANELKVEITGKNDKAIPNFMFGLDYVRVVPTQ